MTREIFIDTAGPVPRSGNLAPGEICLSFDDGPHPTRTAAILDVLKRDNWRANFFSLGVQADANKSVIRRAADEGHVVGSHSYSHRNLADVPLEAAKAEIEKGHAAVSRASGQVIPFFRFPYGAGSAQLDEYVETRALSSFVWNMDSLDWKIKNEDELLAHIMAELEREKRGILLFHDIHERTVNVLPRVIEKLKDLEVQPVVFVPSVLGRASSMSQ